MSRYQSSYLKSFVFLSLTVLPERENDEHAFSENQLNLFVYIMRAPVLCRSH